MARMKQRGNVRPKVLLNVGLGFDLLTGVFIKGKYGENILNGGLPQFMTTSGPTNNYKSWVTDYLNLTALNRIINSSPTSYYDKYDAEMNVEIEKQNKMGRGFDNLDDDLITGPNANCELTDSSIKKGDIWKSDFISFVNEQLKEKKITFNGYLDPYTSKPLELIPPVFFSIDTITEMTTTALEKDLQKYTQDDGSDNTDAMRKGKFKTGLIEILPEYLNKANAYCSLVAQVGETIDMGGKFSPKPMKKLQYLKEVDKIKGVPRVFYSLPGLGLLFHNAKNLLKSDRTDVLYPSKRKNYMVNDLNIVRCTVLRNKHGHDGLTLVIIISKSDGVLADLSNYHTCKDKEVGNNFGISGNATTFHFDLCPDVNISRPTVRDMLETNKKFAKAVEYTREMFQLSLYKPELLVDGTLCSPKELYDDIKALGYDWDMLLEKTVIWYEPDHYRDDRLYLTIMDLLEMRKGTYHPYWLAEDKKTILPANKFKLITPNNKG